MKTLLATSSCFESTQHGQMPLYRWLYYYHRLFNLWQVKYLLCVNDGIACLPSEHFFRYTIDTDTTGIELREDKFNIQAFHPRLGRPKFHLYIGWWRSIAGMIATARRNEIDRIIYIEWDFFVLSAKMFSEIAETQKGIVSFWSPYYQFPECALQIITREHYNDYLALATQKIHADSEAIQDLAELSIPWTEIRRHLKGDRYPELGHGIPEDADYTAQTDLSYTASFDETTQCGKLVKTFPHYGQLPSKKF